MRKCDKSDRRPWRKSDRKKLIRVKTKIRKKEIKKGRE